MYGATSEKQHSERRVRLRQEQIPVFYAAVFTLRHNPLRGRRCTRLIEKGEFIHEYTRIYELTRYFVFYNYLCLAEMMNINL